MILCIALAFTIEGSAAQTIKVGPSEPEKPPATPPRDRAAQIASYQHWCGKPLPLAACTDEIISVDKELLSRAKEEHRTGRGYNAGNSLVGCSNYCVLRHYPHDTPEECKTTVATFERMAERKPYLWRTDLRQILREKCRIPF